MLHQFLTANKAELLKRCRAKASERLAPGATAQELASEILTFLDQLIDMLRREELSMGASHTPNNPDTAPRRSPPDIGKTAAEYGHYLLSGGFAIDQAIHTYGDLCQAITGLATERGEAIGSNEYQTLNACLDTAIADAVTEFAHQRDVRIDENRANAMNERVAVLAHELRNHIHTAILAQSAIKTGNISTSGATAGVLDRSLIALRDLVDRSLAEAKAGAPIPPRFTLFSVADFIAEIRLSASLEAQARGCRFSVSTVDPDLVLNADRDLLLSAVGNVVKNGFKFTKAHTAVDLEAYGSGDRILIEIRDHCGGLPPAIAERMFLPFTQAGDDRSGLGLGLSIAARAVAACNGHIAVRDIPGVGCVFTFDLPRHSLSSGSRGA